MKDLNKRILTAAIFVPLLLLIIYFGDLLFLALICLVTVFSSIEFFNLSSIEVTKNRKIYLILISLMLIISVYFYDFYIDLFLTVLIFSSILYELKTKDFSKFLLNLGLTFVYLLYFGWFLAHAVLLRNINSIDNLNIYATNTQNLTDIGFFLVVLVFACTFLNDTGAFIVGNYLGKFKLAPNISPSKTIEGTIGGIVLTIIVSLSINLIFSNPVSINWAIIFALVISLSATVGDLFESIIKRGAGVKDSGSILPGHGGFLDRFDSLIFVFPCFYYTSIIYYYYSGVLLF